MSEPGSYTLEELARAFNLTPRTARHYIANVLPPRHKTGRGRRARYSQDTWNCFAFIRKARRDRLTMRQISNLLCTLGQSQVEQVVQGLEELSIVPTAPEPCEVYSSPCMAGEIPEAVGEDAESKFRWQLLYTDDELQITYRGQASPRQREQVRMAAAYIKRILKTPA